MYETTWSLQIGKRVLSWIKYYDPDYIGFTERYEDETLVFVRFYKLCFTKYK